MQLGRRPSKSGNTSFLEKDVDRFSITRASCRCLFYGGLAQLARAPALQAGGQRFESVILHDSDADNYALCIMNYALERDL